MSTRQVGVLAIVKRTLPRVRNQDAVIKMSRAAGDLIWILGPHENWSSEFEKYLLETTGNSFAWAYHPHAPMVLSNGNILMFDNGTWRASPFDDRVEAEDNFSRAVEYAIDEETMQAVQVWEYGSDAQERLFAPFLGDADTLNMTDNVLMTIDLLFPNSEVTKLELLGHILPNTGRIVITVPDPPLLPLFPPVQSGGVNASCHDLSALNSKVWSTT